MKTKLCLSERVFVCSECGLVIDRDLNAAMNLKREALRINSKDAQSCGESLNGRGDDSAGCLFEGSETIVSEAISGESEILLQHTMGQCK